MNNEKVKILIIDDQAASRIVARRMLEEIFSKISSESLYLQEASHLNEGIQKLQEEAFHIIILDKDLGTDGQGVQINGTDHIRELLSIRPLAQLLMMTADHSPKDIAKAIKAGAADYLFKGGKEGEAEYREAVVSRTLERAKSELAEATRELRPVDTSLYGEFVAVSSAMRKLKQTCEAYAESNRPVLLLGATGLGKGAVARLLNKQRAKYLGQKDRLFVDRNIGSLPEETAQSEIFGHEPFAFTGAGNRVKQGFLELCSEGDLFLDEIGDASPEIQLKLLKVIEERKFTRLGGNKELLTGARFIFATNKNLVELVSQGKFRADLLARISTLEIQIPSLEDRKEDLPEIIKYLVERANAEHKDRKLLFKSFPKELIAHLCRDDIEGNIRGIENEVIRLALGSPTQKSGFVAVSNWQSILVPSKKVRAKAGINLNMEALKTMPTSFLHSDFPGLKKAREIFERRVLEEALEGSNSLSDVAKKLKVTVPAVHQKLAVAKLRIKKRKKG